jgi:hypothetical protein
MEVSGKRDDEQTEPRDSCVSYRACKIYKNGASFLRDLEDY